MSGGEYAVVGCFEGFHQLVLASGDFIVTAIDFFRQPAHIFLKGLEVVLLFLTRSLTSQALLVAG